jgi:hypothetical protein|tara:strand:- start:268 stop:516 length:249 start_codon:yes stop_codon:yes gene_type:complete
VTPQELSLLQKSAFEDGTRQGMHLFVQQFIQEFGCAPLEMAQACAAMIVALRTIRGAEDDETVAVALAQVEPYIGPIPEEEQ